MFFTGSSDVPLAMFNFNLDRKCSQQSYCNLTSVRICLSLLLLVKVDWVWIFVLGPKASHLPNIDKMPVSSTIKSLGSKLLHIMVTFFFLREQISTCYG
jgi:hypothetical protein